MGVPMKYFAPIFIMFVLMTALFFIPISSDKVDVYFTVKVTNDIWNNPKISYVDVHTEPATLIPSTFSMGSLISSGDLDLYTIVGSKSTQKSIGDLYIIEFNEKTVHYKVPGVLKEDANNYIVILRENRNEIDREEGLI